MKEEYKKCVKCKSDNLKLEYTYCCGEHNDIDGSERVCKDCGNKEYGGFPDKEELKEYKLNN